MAQSTQAGARVREQTLTEHAGAIHTAAGYMVEALRTGKGLHLLGEGPLAHLAAYLAEAFHRPSDQRTLPARLLDGAGEDGPSRAVEAFVRFGEVVLVFSETGASRVVRAASLARGCKARVVCVCAAPVVPQVSTICDAVIPVDATGPILAEVTLAVGHALRELVLTGLQGGSTRPPTAEVSVPHSSGSLSDLGVIDKDSAGGSEVSHESDDGELLAQAIEHNLAPPTDPRGRVRRKPKPLRFRCGACLEIINTEARHAGRKGQCPHCYCEFRIPEADGGMDATPIPPEAITNAPPTHPNPTRRRTRRRTRRAERRRSSRFTVRDAIVRFQPESYPDGVGYLEPHSLEDLSLTGLRFVGRAAEIKIGDIFYFAVDFPAFPSPVRFKGEVRRVMILKDGLGCSAGVRFLEYVGDAEIRIRRLLEHENLRSVRRR